MFEFKGIGDAIPQSQLYLYYFILLLLYATFLRKVKLSMLSFTILLLFNQGFIVLLDSSNRPSKLIFLFLSISLFIAGKFKKSSLNEKKIVQLIFIVSIIHYLTYLVNDSSLLWATFQLYKVIIPVLLFFGISGLNLNRDQALYYSQLIIKLMFFQALFSLVKIITIGLRENIIGSISNTGGGVGIVFAILSLILVWQIKGKKIAGKDWFYVLLFLSMPLASNKRAIWFIYPIVIAMLVIDKIDKRIFRKLTYLALITPIMLYVGVRLNPSLNVEKKIWGTFDINYVIDYSLSYSGVSEDKREEDLSQGRWGTISTIIRNIIDEPFSLSSILGFERDRSGALADFGSEDYGIMYGTMISGLGIMLLKYGWIATILLIYMYILMIKEIKDKKVQRVLTFVILWDLVLYSGSFINGSFEPILLVIIIRLLFILSKRDNSVDFVVTNNN